MRQITVTGLLIVLTVTPAFAQGGGTIGIFEDQIGVNCNIVDGTQSVKTLWVVHIETSGATAARFSAPVPACMNGAIWLGDTAAFDQCGFGIPENNSQMGLSCSYGGCFAGPIVIVGIMLFTIGSSSVCCEYPVLADPGAASGQIEVTDCENNVTTASGFTSFVNGDSSCPCFGTVANEQSTWGAVKALFFTNDVR